MWLHFSIQNTFFTGKVYVIDANNAKIASTVLPDITGYYATRAKAIQIHWDGTDYTFIELSSNCVYNIAPEANDYYQLTRNTHMYMAGTEGSDNGRVVLPLQTDMQVGDSIVICCGNYRNNLEITTKTSHHGDGAPIYHGGGQSSTTVLIEDRTRVTATLMADSSADTSVFWVVE
jgi:hypothetical protein